jgi:hypothetical protein
MAAVESEADLPIRDRRSPRSSRLIAAAAAPAISANVVAARFRRHRNAALPGRWTFGESRFVVDASSIRGLC